MATRLPDGSPLPATRAELLATQAEQVAEREHALLSLRRALAGGGWILLGLVGATILYAGLREDGVGRVVGVVVAAALVGVATWRLVGHARRTHRLARELRSWQVVDRTLAARRLSAGDIPTELRTVFDLRDHPDFTDRVRQLLVQRVSRVNPMGLLLQSLGGGLLAGLALLPLFGLLDSGTTHAGRAGCAVGLAVLVLPVALRFTTIVRENLRRHRQNHTRRIELDAWHRRRQATHGEAPPEDAGSWVGVGASLAAVALLGYLALRLSTASALAVVITGWATLAILLTCLLVVLYHWRRDARLHVIPLVVPGDEAATAVTTPTREVDLERTGDALLIRPQRPGVEAVSIPLSDILAVQPMDSPGFWARAVAVVTTDGPVVLAGKDPGGHPALRGVDEGLTTG